MSNEPTIQPDDLETNAAHHIWERANRGTTISASSGLGAAAYIVGCLASQDLIRLDIDDKDTFDRLNEAIRLVAACLRSEVVRADTGPILPFKW